MLIGHESLSTLLDQYLAKMQDGSALQFPFLIISGPKHIGKMTCIHDKIQRFLGGYAHQDLLSLEDASEYIGKEHIFKVDVDEKDQLMSVEGRDAVLDMGARQLNRRLQMAPAGSHKVLLLENIERMNGAAANAFLKSLEEPLPGRIIIATSADLDRVLPTIQSRAMIFRTQAPTKSSSLAYLSREFSDHDALFLSLLLDYFHGAIGSVISAIQNKDLAIIEHFEQLLAVRNGTNHRQQYSLLRDMYHKAGGERILDVLIERFGRDAKDISAFLQAKKLLTSNINDDHVLFGLGYDSIKSKA